MKKSPPCPIFLALAIAASATLPGCATSDNKPMYGWTGYQPQVYEYIKNDAPDYQAQMDILEKSLAQMQANHVDPPPGFYAQLGLLYAKTGQQDRALAAFDAEKAHFPESAVFMDFLSNTMKSSAQESNSHDKP